MVMHVNGATTGFATKLVGTMRDQILSFSFSGMANMKIFSW